MNKKINNFLDPKNLHRRLSPRLKRILLWLAGCTGVIIVIAAALFFIYRQPAKRLYQSATAAKDHFYKAQDQLLAQDFEQAGQSLQSAVAEFTSAHDQFNTFRWLRLVPYIGTQISAIDNLLIAGINTGESLITVSATANAIITPLQKNNEASLNSLTPEETRQLLKSIVEAKPELEKAKTSIDQAVDHVNKIPKHGLVNKIKDIALPFKEKATDLQRALDRGISATQIIPSIAGYPDKKTYLFLLQNNTELRPTGGFIGTYGILKVQDGDIKSFQTDNVYNLDKPAEAWLNIEPPWPLTRYNAVFQWFFRDANWSPDFPTTAQKVEWFYQQERGQEKNLNGVIAVTPTFIQSLLSVTGDIKVNGLTFTSTNLVETLQYQVEQGFLRQGLAESERKEIIGVLSKAILEKLLDLPKSKWSRLWEIFSKDITEKQILIYLQDPAIQNLIIKENWGGAVKETAGDYLFVVDANLASLKTDPAVNRTIDYRLRRDGKNIIADLTITYENNGKLTWKTTRYRTYTRVFVPSGSTLLTATGQMIDCKQKGEGSVETSDDLGKISFGTFICIEPDEKKSLSFKYKLPDRVTESLDQGSYSLYVQKQAGTSDYPLTLNLSLKRKPLTVLGIDKSVITGDNTLSISSSLSKDRQLNVTY